MSIIPRLIRLDEQPGKRHLVKRYLLDCCEQLLMFRSGDCLPRNLKVARAFLKGRASAKQMHRAEWEIEGNAFAADHYAQKDSQFFFRADINVKSDLQRVRISTGLNAKLARKHLVDMAYFIDHVFCYVQNSSNWLFEESAEAFMCPRLFRRYFG